MDDAPLRRLCAIGANRRSGVEPSSGLLCGTGAHTLTVTVPGALTSALPLGERGFIAALLDRARAGGIDLGALDRLRHARGRIPAADALELRQRLSQLLHTVGGEPGWALYASSTDRSGTYMRALVATIEPTVLLATSTAALGVDREGLRLRLRGLSILGWRRDDDQTVLHAPNGERLLRNTAISAALLRRIAHGRTHATLIRRPLSDLAAPLLGGIQNAATLAADHDLPLLLGSHPPEPVLDADGRELVAALENGRDGRRVSPEHKARCPSSIVTRGNSPP